MSNSYVVLAVDDEPFNLEILEEILEDRYELHTAKSGPECFEVLANLQPSVILMDVSMPNMDGYEVCRRLKSNQKFRDIPVMFVSARGALDERIQGYDAGGEDYIVKPFAREELEAKLRGLFKTQDQQRALECQVKQATEIAFSAMSSSSEIGVVMQFIERTQDIDNIEGLAALVLDTLAAYGLVVSIEMRIANDDIRHFSSHGKVTPIVTELFDLLKKKGRMYSFKPRMMINYTMVSFLVMNMSHTDHDKVGRLKDNLCFIASSTEQCLSTIITQAKLKDQKAVLQRVVSIMRAKFEQLAWILKETHRANEKIFRDLQLKFDQHIPTMGLEDDQEKYINQALDSAIEESIARVDNADDVKRTFADVEHLLRELIKS